MHLPARLQLSMHLTFATKHALQNPQFASCLPRWVCEGRSKNIKNNKNEARSPSSKSSLRINSKYSLHIHSKSFLHIKSKSLLQINVKSSFQKNKSWGQHSETKFSFSGYIYPSYERYANSLNRFKMFNKNVKSFYNYITYKKCTV